MKRSQVTPVILTMNESPNIGRCLSRLHWADEIIVLDSGSSDRTVEICSTYDNVRVETRPFDTHSAQWNHAISLATTPWILALDADFMLQPDFESELESLSDEAGMNGYVARFRYCVNGKPLRASLYPPKTVLFRKDRCSYLQDGHTQLLEGDLPSAMLSTVIDHDDRKTLQHWLGAQQRYAVLECDKLLHSDSSRFSLPDRIRSLIWPAAPLVLVYTLLVRRTLLDGWPGLFYAFQRTYAELLVSLALLEAKLGNPSPECTPDEIHSEHTPPLSRSSGVADCRSASLRN